MKVESKMTWAAASCFFTMLILGATLSAASPTVNIPEKTIASKQVGNIVIALTNETGQLTSGENHFCVLFQNAVPAQTIDVQDVIVDFRLLVGRIQEMPRTAHLSQSGAGRFCGPINLGPQYYSPASYYAFVRYVESTGKKKSVRLSLTVK
jgi:hypothetical protein